MMGGGGPWLGVDSPREEGRFYIDFSQGPDQGWIWAGEMSCFPCVTYRQKEAGRKLGDGMMPWSLSGLVDSLGMLNCSEFFSYQKNRSFSSLACQIL